MSYYRLKSKIFEYHTCSYCKKTDKGEKKRFKKCSKCQRSFYCSKRCQKKDWKSHGYYCHVYSHMDAVSTDILVFAGLTD